MTMKMRHRRRQPTRSTLAGASTPKLHPHQRRILRAYSRLMPSLFVGYVFVPSRSYREPRLYRPSQVTP